MVQHSDGVVFGKFCALRTTKCKDGNEYQKNCKPKPKGWSKEYFWQGSKYDDGTKTIVKKYFEAHHLLCVAAVTECIVGAPGIKRIVKNTDWCINDKINMFAMPLWGHTIKYYCTIESDDFFDADKPYFRQRKKAPKFKNIPLHDSDHDLYIEEEVKPELKKIARSIKNSKKKHKKKIDEIKSQLNDKAEYFRGELQSRGTKRVGGTHAAWQKGIKKPHSDWYKPFSMSKKPRKRTFPTTNFGSGIGRKIIQRANSYFYH